MYKTISFTLVVGVGWFYWLAKSPASFGGLYLPDFVLAALTLAAGYGLLLVILGKLRFTWQEIGFGVSLVLVPLCGLVGEQIGAPSPDWEAYVDSSRLASAGSVMATVRPYVFTVVLFLLSSRVIGAPLGRKGLVWASAIAVAPHILWGIAQNLYIVAPSLLLALPVKVGEISGGEFNLHIVRATGLTINPFYYSFLLLVTAFIADLHGRKRGMAAWLIAFSWLSISRSFFVASLPALFRVLSSLRLRWRLLIICVAAGVVAAMIEVVLAVLELRFQADVSSASRSSTNSLALQSFLDGNFLGFGFSNPYYTDSTVASLLIGGGLPAVLFYFLGWALLFHCLWRSAQRDVSVLAFAFMFFATAFLVGSPESQPGLFIFFVAYWVVRADAKSFSKEISSREARLDGSDHG